MLDDGLGILDQMCPFIPVAGHDLVRVQAIRKGGHAQVCLQAGFVAEQAARIEVLEGELAAIKRSLGLK